MSKKIKVQLVDDNQSYLSMLSNYLLSNNYDVVVSNSGKEAQIHFLEFIPDIVVTDLVMPGVDGIELLVEFKKINSNIIIIAMSGGNSGFADTYLNMADKLGANAVLNKPFELSELLSLLKKLESKLV